MISLIQRWLKAGVLENGKVLQSEEGMPQGGAISMLLSNVYLHKVLDLWFERVLKRHLQGKAYLEHYIDDLLICFQYESDAHRVQNALRKRWGKSGLTLEPSNTKLVAFGQLRRGIQSTAEGRGRRRSQEDISRTGVILMRLTGILATPALP